MTGVSWRQAHAAAWAACLLLALLFHVGDLGRVPHGEHAWRDADGIGVARSMAREGIDLLRPRVVERGDRVGIVGMELPLLNALGALTMRRVGVVDAAARLWIWLALVPLSFGAAALARRLASRSAAWVAGALVGLQPLVLIFARKCMPEIPMLAAVAWAVAFGVDAVRGRGRWTAWLSGLLLGLAAVLKPTAFAAAVPLGWVAIEELRRGVPRAGLLRRIAPVVALPVLAVVLWFAHARALDLRYGLPLFRLENHWFEWVSLLGDERFASAVWVRPLHLIWLWPAVIWMVLRWRCVWTLVRERRALAAWVVASWAGLLLFGRHDGQHAYYAIPLVLPVVIFVAEFVVRASERHARAPWVVAGAVAVLAVTGLVRTEMRLIPPTREAEALAAARDRWRRAGLSVVTDGRTPVVALVLVDRVGWGLPAGTLTPGRLETLRRAGARTLVESSFGGWLDAGTRAVLPPPLYSDPDVRAYALE